MYVYIIAVIRCDTKNIVTTLKLVFKVDLIIFFFQSKGNTGSIALARHSQNRMHFCHLL